MKLKVCGMKYQENIADVAGLQPDYMGFIFYEKSARFVEEQSPIVSNAIKKTGVFVDASIDYIIEQIEKHNLQAVQLHGNESPEFCDELKLQFEECQFDSREQNDIVISSNRFPLPNTRDRNDEKIEIIKVFSIKDEFDFNILTPYEAVCDYYLFDTKGKLPGGNGYTFDWSVLENYPSTKPYFLSGGIGLDELENVLSFLHKQESRYCYAIDVNSSFEIQPGLKNIEKLKEFKQNVITRSKTTK